MEVLNLASVGLLCNNAECINFGDFNCILLWSDSFLFFTLTAYVTEFCTLHMQALVIMTIT